MVDILESPLSLNRIHSYVLSGNKRAIDILRSRGASEEEPFERDGNSVRVVVYRLPHAVPVAGVYDKWWREVRILRGVGVEGAAGSSEGPALVESDEVGKWGRAWGRGYGHRHYPGTDHTLVARLCTRTGHEGGKRQ